MNFKVGDFVLVKTIKDNLYKIHSFYEENNIKYAELEVLIENGILRSKQRVGFQHINGIELANEKEIANYIAEKLKS